jgi:HlyD family secretion protein
MQVIANIDQADIGLVEQAKSVRFSVDAFPGKDFDGKIQQMRLNPQTVQNVVTYNVVIDVSNPDQVLKPGMTANLTITIDERNNVLKVPNAALRFDSGARGTIMVSAGASKRTVPIRQALVQVVTRQAAGRVARVDLPKQARQCWQDKRVSFG